MVEDRIAEATEDLVAICKDITESLERYIANGLENANTQEIGAVADIIKDMEDARKNSIKSLYYTEVLKAMERSENIPTEGESMPMTEEFKRTMDTDRRHQMLAEYLEEITDTMMDLAKSMDPTEKQTAKNRLMMIHNSIV